MGNVSNEIPDCYSCRPALLDLFIFSDARICSAMAFPALGNLDYVVVASIDFLSNGEEDGPFNSVSSHSF